MSQVFDDTRASNDSLNGDQEGPKDAKVQSLAEKLQAILNDKQSKQGQLKGGFD